MSIFVSLGIILGPLGGGALLLKAPSFSSTSVDEMEENIRSEYVDVSRETESSTIPGIVSPPIKPLEVNKKKDTLDMLYKDISSGIKYSESSNNKEEDDEEKNKSSLKPSLGILTFLFDFFSKGFGFLLFLFGALVSLFILFFRRDKKN